MEREKISARNYRELIVWQQGIQLAKLVYRLTEKFPRHEIYALADQIRQDLRKKLYALINSLPPR